MTEVSLRVTLSTVLSQRIDGRLNGSLSIRFDSVLGESERAELSTLLGLSGARLASWKAHAIAGRTYARVAYPQARPAAALAAFSRAARIDEPALVVLEIHPPDGKAAERVFDALAGPAGPAGVLDALRAGSSIVVEVDVARTPLSLVVDLIDVELGAPGRRIVPLIGLDDATLSEFAGSVLGERLDASRLIETFSEPLVHLTR